MNQAGYIKNGLFYGSNLILLAGGIAPISIILTNLTYFSYIGYIKLKKVSTLNTLFGAVVGALPILVGITNNPLESIFNELLIGTTGYLFLW
jgi:protoheme IX farnesyltransferase